MSSYLYILPAVIALAAIVMAFMRNLPSSATAFVAMVLSQVFGWGFFASGTLWFWSIAMAIATGIKYISPLPPISSLRYYTIGGALVGSVLGVLIGSMSSLIIGGAIGAALGFIAFRRTPVGQMNASASRILSIFADVALPALITFFIAIITLAQLPLFLSL